MRLLAIDTALGACSAAILDTTSDIVVARAVTEMERGHAEAIMPMIGKVVGARENLDAIDRIVVTTGPGSFTGIRVGLSAARGLALATGKPLIGITTLVVLAVPALAIGDGRAVAAAIDARHGRVYFQIFAPTGLALAPARLVPARDAARMAGDGPVRLVGSGAPLIIAAADGVRHETGDDGLWPDPVWLARLGAAAPLPERPPRPVYLRPADAKPQTGGRVARV